MKFQSKILRIMIAIVACAAFAGGCGDDTEPTGSITPNPNNTHPDAGTNADTTPKTNGSDEDSSEDPDITAPDADGPDVDVPDEGPFCNTINLGVLGPNESIGTTFDFADASNEVQLSCAQGVVAKEIIVRFSVEQTSRIKISQV